MNSSKLVKTLVKISDISSGITCWGVFYQPKSPKKIKVSR